MKRPELILEIVEDFAAFKRAIILSHADRSSGNMPTPAQIGVLVMIGREGSQNLKDLAGHSCMSSSAATQLVDGLVADGLLSRTEDADDRRRIRLTLTTAGKRTLAKAKERHAASFAKLLTPLSVEELKEWQRLQRKIIDNAS